MTSNVLLKRGKQVWIQANPTPMLAEVRDFDRRRPHLVKVVYLGSRTAAWVRRSRIVGERSL